MLSHTSTRTVDNLEWLKEILFENRLYIPTALQLNDPVEASPPLTASSLDSLIIALKDLHIQRNPFWSSAGLRTHFTRMEAKLRPLGRRGVLQMIKADLYPNLQRFRIYPLAKNVDNTHLWKEYAGNHTGYCLEFRNGQGFGPMWEVRYEDIALDITGPERWQSHFLFYKTTAWKREQEVRIVLQQGPPEKVPFNPRALNRIILGKNMSRSNEETIRVWANSRQPSLPVLSERNM